MEDFILEHWEQNASKYGQTHHVSWGDEHAIKLEIGNISSYIEDGDRVLDVGCANGFAAIMQCGAHKLKSMTGVDFSKNMTENALLNKERSEYKAILDFTCGDVRELNFPDDQFNVVYTTRVIINLPTWEEQKAAINECLRVTKPGGVFVLSEAFYEPLVKLNAMRLIVGLPPLVEHDFNRYIKKKRLIEFLESKGLSYEVNDFSSLYYVGTRLLRELCTDYNSFEGYTNPINEDSYQLELKYSGGDLGIQQAFAITKNQ